MKKKLVDLLNEFESKKKIYVKWNLWEKWNIFQWNFANTDLKIISKKYEFIKWLVYNDKVDWNFIDYAEIHQTKRELESNYEPYDIEKQYYERLLMLLSIQDEPIEFLVSVLK